MVLGQGNFVPRVWPPRHQPAAGISICSASTAARWGKSQVSPVRKFSTTIDSDVLSDAVDQQASCSSSSPAASGPIPPREALPPRLWTARSRGTRPYEPGSMGSLRRTEANDYRTALQVMWSLQGTSDRPFGETARTRLLPELTVVGANGCSHLRTRERLRAGTQ